MAKREIRAIGLGVPGIVEGRIVRGCNNFAGELGLLPGKMEAEILYSENTWHDYCSGMAYLTVGKMFDDVQLLKE